MTFSGKIGPSFDSYGHSYVKNDQKLFLPWIATSNIPQTDKNWAYFGLFRPKIDQKMGSYKITFTKKVVFYAQLSSVYSNQDNFRSPLWHLL